MVGYSYKKMVALVGKDKTDFLFTKNNVPKVEISSKEDSEYRKLSETAHGKILHKYLDSLNINHTHIAGESGQRGTSNIMAMMAKKKAQGTSKGFPDYIIIGKNNNHKITIYIELKKARGVNGGLNGSTISQEQVDWLNYLKDVPFSYTNICHGSNEAIQFITDIISMIQGLSLEESLKKWIDYPKKEFTIF